MTITQSWQAVIDEQSLLPYFKQLESEVAKQRAEGINIFPQAQDVFNAFGFFELSDTKVVILGQDPYHGMDNGICQAHGLAFSVQKGIKVPPSLVNMYKELETDIDTFSTPSHGNLTAWAQQGVLLLNTVLTVQQAKAHSHAKLGWEMFTDAIINTLNEQHDGCVFILWGAHAHKKGKHINTDKHCVLKGPHPSPLSAYRGFFGCQHFSKANQWLNQIGKAPIDWSIPE